MRKTYPARRRKPRNRHWKVRQLAKEEQDNARRGDADKQKYLSPPPRACREHVRTSASRLPLSNNKPNV